MEKHKIFPNQVRQQQHMAQELVLEAVFSYLGWLSLRFLIKMELIKKKDEISTVK